MRSRRPSEIRREVLEVLRRLAERTGDAVYLFGSYAGAACSAATWFLRLRAMDFPQRVELVGGMPPEHLGFDIIPLTPRELGERAKTCVLPRDIEVLDRDKARKNGLGPSSALGSISAQIGSTPRGPDEWNETTRHRPKLRLVLRMLCKIAPCLRMV